jgi:hypothetical protein
MPSYIRALKDSGPDHPNQLPTVHAQNHRRGHGKSQKRPKQPTGCDHVAVEANEGERSMADEKMKSENAVPQADKQAHTDIAQHEGQDGAQAKVINQQETEKRKKD